MSLTLTIDDPATTANSPYYASDGRGAVTATAADSLVVDTRTSVIQSVNASGGFIRIFHDVDKVAGGVAANNVAALVYDGTNGIPCDCGPNGIEVLGNWYVEVSAAATEATVIFRQGTS